MGRKNVKAVEMDRLYVELTGNEPPDVDWESYSRRYQREWDESFRVMRMLLEKKRERNEQQV